MQVRKRGPSNPLVNKFLREHTDHSPASPTHRFACAILTRDSVESPAQSQVTETIRLPSKLFFFPNYIYILCGFRFFALKGTISPMKSSKPVLKKKLQGISSHFINKNTRNGSADRNSSRSKFNHPFFILLQVCSRNRLSNFLKSQFKVSFGDRHLKFLFRKCTDLFRT